MTRQKSEYCPGEGRSTESYALVWWTKHTLNGVRFFRANSCRRRIRNIISLVERFSWKPLCSPCRIPMRSQYSLRWRAMVSSSILPACATSEIPLWLSHSSRSFYLWNAKTMVSFHFCATTPPLSSKYKRRYRAVSGTGRDHC